MKMEQTACSETSAYKFQTPGNYPEESIQQERNISSIYVRFPHQNIARISVLSVFATRFVHKILHLTFVQLN